MNRNKLQLIAIAIALFGTATRPGFGSGPRDVNGAGMPMRWDNTSPIVYNLDPGSLGTLSHSQAAALMADAFSRWSGIPQVQLSFTAGADLPGDINAVGLPATNPYHWALFWRKEGDGKSPVMFDTDGTIINSMFGAGAADDILGVAAIDTPISLSATIDEGSIVINGLFFDGVGPPSSPADSVSQLAFEAVAVHEVGHFIGLDHCWVNHELAGDFNLANDKYIPTMFPVTVDDEEQIVTPNPDDMAGAIGLYPASGAAAATWSVSGAVLKGTVPFQGAEVIVRRVGNELMYAYEAISGQKFQPCNVGGSCYPCDGSTSCNPGDPPAQGAYDIQGIVALPLTRYTVCVEQLDRRISLDHGTFVGPLATPPTLPGPEECYDLSESADPSVDDPDAWTMVDGTMGMSTTGIDIHLNDFVSTDTSEPNNTLGTAKDLPALSPGHPRDTVGGILGSGDLDFYKVSVVAGHTYRIDIDAKEIGSSLDPVMKLFDNSGTPILVVDDAIDPDSGMPTPDPAIDYKATFTGLLRIGISSFGDSDLDGVGQATSGPYWLRVIDDADSDGDGVPDRFDACPLDRFDDIDRDGVCGNADNCPHVYNPDQTNTDGGPYGDACQTNDFLTVNTPGSWFSGLFNGSHYGAAVASAGDDDLDGRDDVIVGAPDEQGGNGTNGESWLQYGLAAPGELGGLAYTSYGDDGITPNRYGVSVAPMGDMNCDGFADYVAGDPTARRVYLYYGKSSFDGPLYTENIIETDSNSVHFGQRVALAGDVNGDGAPDLLVADPNHAGVPGGLNRGKAYLFLGSPAPSCAVPDYFWDWTLVAAANGDLLGTGLDGVGDVNGDGRSDVVVGSPGFSNGQSGEGRASLFLGTIVSPWLTASSWTVESNEAGAAFGTVVSRAGDVNGDGYDDFMVSAPNADAGGTDRGTVFVYYGSATGPSTTANRTYSGGQDNMHFGASLAALGDVNKDGYDDIAIGAPDFDTTGGGTDRGVVFVYLGSASGLPTSPSYSRVGLQNGENFGSSVAGADTNGDGRKDLIVGSKNFDSPGKTDNGRVQVFPAMDGGDRDGDGLSDDEDNCPDVYNPSQDDSDTAAGPDGVCGTPDDNADLFGPNNACGGGDDTTKDGVGDACAS